MRIRKKYQVIPTNAKLENGYSTSDKNGYNCEYINNNVGIVESGSNSNGNYVKYADGTMICYFSQNITGVKTPTAWGNIFINGYNPIVLHAYPIEFINTPVVSITKIGGTFWISPTGSGSATNPPSFYAFGGSQSTSQSTGENCIINVFAIGKWK